jgi:hypothetical protein
VHPAPDHARRNRVRAIAAFGLVALPVVGSTFLLPGVAAGTTDAVVVRAAEQRREPAPPPVTAEPEPVAPAGDEYGYVEPTAEDLAAADAFAAAGYSFDDAVALASVWDLPDSWAVKVEGGRLLEQGTALADSPYAAPDAADGVPDEQLAALFLDLGYGLGDAEVLAAQWGVDVAEAKTAAGRELKIVGALPFVDLVPAEAVDDGAVTAFFDGGYSYDDAVALSQIWGLTDSYVAKVKAGGYLRDGTPLVDTPYADPAAAAGLGDAELAQLFLASGYTVDDAGVLAAQWGVDVADAKVAAGAELKTVGVLPFVDVVLPGAAG